ncbi:MAG: hypothetical protein GYA60_09425 [Candidatus Methanofastidiosa archaeon]|nr:hypothetical protein [Candidatus Methanofastidiosa archaeon]
MGKDISTILYKIEGDGICLGKVPAELIGNILLNFQGLIYSLGQYLDDKENVLSRRTKSIEDKYGLCVSFKEGSVLLEMTPAYQYPILLPHEDKPYQKTLQDGVFYTLKEIVDVIMNDESYYSKINEIITDPVIKYRLFNYLHELIPKTPIHESIIFYDFSEVPLQYDLSNTKFISRVTNLLNEEIEKDILEIDGVIVRIRDDSPSPVFWVKTFENKLVKVTLPKEQRPKIIDYLSRRLPIKLYGYGANMRRTEIIDIDKIEENREIKIKEIRGVTLSSPIIADLSFEKYDNQNDFWIVSNDDLGVVGVDDTLNKAISVFETDLYELYEFYKDIPNEKLTERTKRVKNNLINILK